VMVPVAFMFVASFMPPAEIFRSPFPWWPSQLYVENFLHALRGNDGRYLFVRTILNSTGVALSISLATVVLATLTGYSLAKLPFRGRTIVFLLILSTLMIPFETIMIPLYIVATGFGLQDSFAGLIVPFMVSAFGVFLMRQSLLNFPNELLDAARIDGAGEFGIFWRIVLPNVVPAMAVLGVLTFQSQWDNLIWPLLVVQSEEMKTIPLYIASFTEEKHSNEGAMVAVAAIASLPMLVLFVALSRYFLRGANLFAATKG
jgi:multiple sugar transport system permease protein